MSEERLPYLDQDQDERDRYWPTRSGSSTLHNMSMRPRTHVRCDVKPRSEVLVRFALGAAGSAARRTWLRPTRKAKQGLLDAWETLGLRGATLVYDWVPPEPPAKYQPPRPELLDATDEELVVNVLARTRSCLLLGDAPLSLEPAFLQRELYTDDPRLVRIARERGVRKHEHG